VNLPPGETGNVLFAAKPRQDTPSGTVIRNKATIQFEVFAPMDTNEVVNIIDSTRPTCTVNPLPAETSTLDFPISWSGTDAVGEIESYSILVSVDGGSFTPFLEKTTDTSATFSGELGKTYGFLCIATDTAGNIEVQDGVAEAVTQIAVPSNQPPVARCQNVTVPTELGVCTANASVNAGSSDPDGDPITLSQSPAGPYSLGTTNITLTVRDDEDASASCSATVTVVDQQPPTIKTVTANPNVLWPPDHRIVPVTVAASASDICTAAPVCKITSVSSNEPINGTGDGDQAPDWKITGNLTVKLRAERSGRGSGRVYTITVGCTDASKNSSTKTVTVTVPRTQPK